MFHELLTTGGFRPVRTLAERDGLIFIEAAKPRDEGAGRAGGAGGAGRAGGAGGAGRAGGAGGAGRAG
jgi:hypothetical protein